MYESNDKMVSHPKHYQSKSGLEVIDVIEAFTEATKLWTGMANLLNDVFASSADTRNEQI